MAGEQESNKCQSTGDKVGPPRRVRWWLPSGPKCSSKVRFVEILIPALGCSGLRKHSPKHWLETFVNVGKLVRLVKYTFHMAYSSVTTCHLLSCSSSTVTLLTFKRCNKAHIHQHQNHRRVTNSLWLHFIFTDEIFPHSTRRGLTRCMKIY